MKAVPLPIELSTRIIELAPEGMRRVYYGLSGSDANETQIKRGVVSAVDDPVSAELEV